MKTTGWSVGVWSLVTAMEPCVATRGIWTIRNLRTLLLLPALLLAGSAAPFTDLDFDSANPAHVQPDAPGSSLQRGPTPDLLPGWQLTCSEVDTSKLFYDSGPPGLGAAILYDGTFDLSPVEGKYALALIPTIDVLGSGAPFPFQLSQTGDVPVGSRSIRFLDYGQPFELRINGSLIPLQYAGASVSGDISAFAGQTAQITFTTITAQGGVAWNTIDSISFSTIPIPEPATCALLGFGLGALIWLQQRRGSAGEDQGVVDL